MIKLEKRVLEYMSEHSDDLFSLLSDLVKFDTQNFITHGLEKKCQLYIADLYRNLGLETDVYTTDSIPGIKEHPGYLPGRGMEDRPNVTGIYYGTHPQSRIMIAAHTDTMPVGSMAGWTVDPFGGVIRDGRIYGLGVSDDKFGIAESYFALKAIKECGIRLKKSVLLTAYADEEYGGGDGALGACVKYPCESYVNLDGISNETWIAALGGGGFEIEVKAEFSTDTLSPIINAMYYIKSELEAMGMRRREELYSNPLYTESDTERSAFRLVEFSAGNFGCNLDSGKLIFIIHTDKPKEKIDRELDEITRKINHVLHKNRLSTTGFKPTTRFFDYLKTRENDPAVEALVNAAAETCGKEIKQCGAALSDLSIFLKYGSPSSFNCGIKPDHTRKTGRYQSDEYVECVDLLTHAHALALFMIRYCGVA